MKKLKGWNKLYVQVASLSLLLVLISFFTDTDLWYKYFNDSCTTKRFGTCLKGLHYHFNYRGYVYVWTGVILSIISIARIISSHKEEDFKN